MKIKFIEKLFSTIVILIFLTNIICVNSIGARNNTAVIVTSNTLTSEYAQQYINGNSSLYTMLGYNVVKHIDPSKTQLFADLWSEVQLLCTHGDWDRILYKNIGLLAGKGGMWYGTEHIGTDDVYWNNVRLVTYMACKTAERLDSGLCYKTMEGGADVVVGFRENIYVLDAIAWSKYFNGALSTGMRNI